MHQKYAALNLEKYRARRLGPFKFKFEVHLSVAFREPGA